ncbi:hypothetical protein VTK56DRAFT_9303 [Thermocarpiscus australiensis]
MDHSHSQVRKHARSADNPRICRSCAAIPFEQLRRGENPENFRYPLGRVSRIRRSPCNFCELVSRALFWDPMRRVTPLHARDEIDVVWSDSDAPGCLAGFTLQGTRSSAWLAFGSSSDSVPRPDPGEPEEELSSEDTRPQRFYLRTALDSKLDSSRVTQWIDKCTRTHRNCVLDQAHGIPGLELLRLIDVVDNCLFETTGSARYVALSYVWGAVPNLRLTKANRPHLMRPGAFRDVPGLLPRTIRDAMSLVRRLNLRYLWVDSLCLLQNDADDLERGVNVMDHIYERSWLTVVAACGHDANAGLVGLHGGDRERKVLVRQVAPGVILGVYFDLDAYLKGSVYDTRAWTFQEHVLSRRILYFVDDKVFFRCRESECLETCEDQPKPRIRRTNTSSMLVQIVDMKHPLESYAVMLFYYTQRVLTGQSDALRAMAGVMRRVSQKLGYRMLEGLPTAVFDRFLLFCGRNLHRREGFPSYSWAGWRGGIDVEMIGDLNDWLQNQTWIIWYKRSTSGVVNLVWDPAANESFPFHDTEAEGYRQRSPFQCALLEEKTSRTAPTENLAVGNPRPYPLLQFWTLSVFLKIDSIDVFRPAGKLADRRGTVRGTVTFDGFEETNFFESEEPVEVILLSEANSPIPGNFEVAAPWNFYHVMLVERSAEGVVERRGIGAIDQESIYWSYPPGPVWKEVLLA